ncbi:MAG: cell division protein SepF [Candidatus Margulisiibacteriota bacterium]|jgi:cell division inhibitor SepF
MGSLIEKMKVFFGFEEDEKENMIDAEINRLKSPKKEANSSPIIRGFKGTLLSGQATPQKLNMAEIKIEEPRIYEDSLSIAANLRNNLPVIINLKHLDKEASKRLIDFVCGTAFAINGHMMKIGENIFIFTPNHIEIVEANKEKTPFEQGLEEEEKDSFFKRALGI